MVIKEELIDSLVIVQINQEYINGNQKKTFFVGTVFHIEDNGIVLMNEDNETIKIPPLYRLFKEAKEGTYIIKELDKVVTNPDYTIILDMKEST